MIKANQFNDIQTQIHQCTLLMLLTSCFHTKNINASVAEFGRTCSELHFVFSVLIAASADVRSKK